MIKGLLFFLAIIFAVLLVQSCSKDERDPCLQPHTTVLRAHTLHHADTGTATLDTLLPNPQLRPLTGGTTQYVFGGVTRLSQFTFSLSNVADSSRWVLRPDSAFAIEDTLTFYYQTELHFLSNSCGYTNFYNLQSVTTTKHAIDSAIIIHPDITTDANVENLSIYY
jgi:hypothetical protein